MLVDSNTTNRTFPKPALDREPSASAADSTAVRRDRIPSDKANGKALEPRKGNIRGNICMCEDYLHNVQLHAAIML
jgi:hypothetical protein